LIAETPEMRWERLEGTDDEVQSLLGFRLEHYRQHGFGVNALWSDSAELVGQAGLQRLGPDQDRVELVVFLSKQIWGRGVATRVSRWFLNRALAECNVSALWATVRPENGPARRLVDRLGYREVGRREHYGYDSLVYRVDRAEWLRAAQGSEGS
jgi:ribosomal-protein-alanine N-acetyltransferase